MTALGAKDEHHVLDYHSLFFESGGYFVIG
jgi:hypothetical protein